MSLKRHNFILLWLGNIPLYMCHIFFFHSSADGCLGCFHVLATVIHATMNTGVRVSFLIMVFSSYVPGSGIAGLYVCLLDFNRLSSPL